MKQITGHTGLTGLLGSPVAHSISPMMHNTSFEHLGLDYVYDDCTLRQVLETMEHHKYASIPMLNRQGEYVGTITEGDLLWGMKKYTNLNLKEAEHIFIHDFERKADYIAVAADSDMKDLISRAMSQNFVPVVDDQNKFIGIITRRSIIEYCYDKLNECDK